MRVRGINDMPHHVVRLAGRWLGAAAAIGAPGALSAQTTQTGMVVSAGVNAESNPYSTIGSDRAGLSADLTLQPTLRLRGSDVSVDVDGSATFRQFVERYGLEDNYGLNANAASRLNERVSVHASGSASYNEGGVSRLFDTFGSAFPAFSRADDPTTAATVPVTDALAVPITTFADLPVVLTDVTLLGRRVRTSAFGFAGGMDAQLDGRSTLAADLSGQVLRFPRQSGIDYNNATAQASYSRRLSELTSVGLVGSFSRSNFLDTRVGDTDTATALVSVDRRFSERWRLSAGIGASFSDIRQPAGLPDVHLTAVNVRGTFCWQDPRSSLCISGARSPQPAATGSVRISDTLSVNYSRTLSARENVTLGGFYTRTGRGRGVATALPGIDLEGVSAGYSNRFRERTSLVVSANVSRFGGAQSGERTNVGASIGVQTRFGALR